MNACPPPLAGRSRHGFSTSHCSSQPPSRIPRTAYSAARPRPCRLPPPSPPPGSPGTGSAPRSSPPPSRTPRTACSSARPRLCSVPVVSRRAGSLCTPVATSSHPTCATARRAAAAPFPSPAHRAWWKTEVDCPHPPLLMAPPPREVSGPATRPGRSNCSEAVHASGGWQQQQYYAGCHGGLHGGSDLRALRLLVLVLTRETRAALAAAACRTPASPGAPVATICCP